MPIYNGLNGYKNQKEKDYVPMHKRLECHKNHAYLQKTQMLQTSKRKRLYAYLQITPLPAPLQQTRVAPIGASSYMDRT
jgi:hypothetical protein